jgi:hypothetical protein
VTEGGWPAGLFRRGGRFREHAIGSHGFGEPEGDLFEYILIVFLVLPEVGSGDMIFEGSQNIGKLYVVVPGVGNVVELVGIVLYV